MAVLVQCPQCFRRISLKHEYCPKCNCNIKNARKQKKVKYVATLYYHSIGKRSTEYFDTLKDAQQADLEHEKAKEEYADNAVLYLGEKVTVEELLKWFLQLKSIRKTARYKSKVYFAHQKLINEAIGPFPVTKLTLSALENFQADLEDDYKPNYVDSVFKTLKQAVNKGVDDDQIPMYALKPFRKLKPSMSSKSSDARYRIVTPDEFNHLYKHALPHHKPLLAILYWSGMRPGEALGLVWQQVYLNRHQFILENDETKTEESRIVPIVPPLVKILKNHPRALHTNHVIHYRNKPINDIYGSMRKLSERAGIPWGRKVRGGWTLHDLRHTWVTNARKAGVKESVLMKITGHKTREMFDRYNFVDEEDARLAGDLLSKYIDSYKKPMETPEAGAGSPTES